MKIAFGSSELCNCLHNLGFSPQHQKGTSHIKYIVPSSYKVPTGMRPFIIVIMGRKDYDPNTKSSYLRQIKMLGFSTAQIIEAFTSKKKK